MQDITDKHTLWIDAICINQADLIERSRQVSTMSRLFRSADQVLCWVGPAVEDADTTLAALNSSALISSYDLAVKEGREIDQLSIENSLDAGACKALRHIVDSTYWTRSWIVQEVAPAKDVIVLYGLVELPWQLLVSLSQLESMLSQWPP